MSVCNRPVFVCILTTPQKLFCTAALWRALEDAGIHVELFVSPEYDPTHLQIEWQAVTETVRTTLRDPKEIAAFILQYGVLRP